MLCLSRSQTTNSDKEIRHLAIIQEFTVGFHHIHDADNPVDAPLCRIHGILGKSIALDFEVIVPVEPEDPDLERPRA